MKQIVLAAGYATRLHPLTLHKPKPLLPVAGRPMIDHVLASTAAIGEFSDTFVVTNHRFAEQFEQWSTGCAVVDDGTTSNDDRLGAIGDLQFVIEQHGIDDDLLVVAGDNLFTGSLAGFGKCCRAAASPVLGVYDVGSLEEARKYGVAGVDADGRLTAFEEKPAEPPSTLIGIALYYYPRAVLPEISRYLAEGNSPDQPGRLVQWLYPQQPVRTWTVPGQWLDIGSPETLAAADALLQNAN